MQIPSLYDGEVNTIHAVVETPKGSRVKFDIDQNTSLIRLSKMLPQGLVFLQHFGFIPNTCAADGDPVDLLLFFEEVTYPGVVIHARVVGILEAEQTEKNGKTVRNDRVIAVASVSEQFAKVKNMKDLDKDIMDEISNFFIIYNKLAGKTFKPIARKDAGEAMKLIKKHTANE